MAETWRRVWGMEIFSRAKISEWRFIQEKCPFSRQHFWRPLFSHWPVFRIFPFFFFQIFRIFYYVKCRIIMTLCSQEQPLFQNGIPLWHLSLRCSYFPAHPTTLLLKILGGTDAWAVPTSNFFGGPSFPVPSRSLPLTEWLRCFHIFLI